MQKILSTIFILFFILMHNTSSAQEIISELKYNSALLFDSHHSKLRSTDTLSLPFIDDFSYSQLDPNHKYPDQNLWLDKDCFVNTTYPVLPPSIGVATFDGLNEYGIPYDTTGVVQQAESDTLTSLPIHMETLSPADSVYLSFFYEKMGVGDYPNIGDILLLELKKSDGSWNEVWQMDGDASAPTIIKFRQLMVPVTDNSYFFNNFQFRFRNIATTSGNNDHWHIDYVRLYAGRSIADTLIQDVAAIYTPGTILKNYEFMPWTQFRNNQPEETLSTFPFTILNNNNVTMNTAIQYFADEIYSSSNVFSSSTSALNFNAGTSVVQANSTFPVGAVPPGDSALLIIKCKATATPDDLRQNDSAYRVQPFFNYYAHDDGSAEKAYGLNAAGGKIAVKYKVNIPDTLRAVQIHFAHIDADISDKLFSILIWKSLVPNTQLIYEQDFLKPSYIDSINGFATYILDTPKLITDTFYVGMLQSFPNFYNVGLDRNTDSHLNSYYNVTGVWSQSSYSGSLMIRPVVGAELPFTSTKNISSNTIKVNCYPNPVENMLHVNVTGIKHAELIITDISGRTMRKSDGIYEDIFVGDFSAGMYLLTVIDKQSKQSFTTRFIKN